MKSRNRRLGIYPPNLFRYEVRIVVAGDDPDKTIVRIIGATNDLAEARHDLQRMRVFKTNCHIYDTTTGCLVETAATPEDTDAPSKLAP